MEALEKRIAADIVNMHHPGVNPFEVMDALTVRCHCCSKDINIKKGKLNFLIIITVFLSIFLYYLLIYKKLLVLFDELTFFLGIFQLTRHVQGSSCKGESKHSQNLHMWLNRKRVEQYAVFPQSQTTLPPVINPPVVAVAYEALPPIKTEKDMSCILPPCELPQISEQNCMVKRKQPDSETEDGPIEKRCHCGDYAKVFKLRGEPLKLVWKCGKATELKCNFCWSFDSELPSMESPMPPMEHPMYPKIETIAS